MSRILLLVLIFTSLQASAQSSIDFYFKKKLSPDQLAVDYNVFRRGLEKIHPGLYRYNSKDHMDSVFLRLKKELGSRSIEDVLQGRDPQLDFTIELIKSK